MPETMNKTTSAGVAPGIVEYYERALLENARPEMVHSRDAQKRPLPPHNGKFVNFRRMIPFAAATQPLQEGVTPDGQTLRQTGFSVMVKPYGQYVPITDELNLYHLDNLHRETAELLSDQAALTLDTLCRDAMCAGLNVQYAGGKTSRGALTASDKLTAADVKEAVRTLKRNNCKPFADGFYHAVVHPDTVFDLTGDSQWIDVARYQDKEKIERYELGCLYKVKFFESSNAKVFEAATTLVEGVQSLTITGVDTAKRTLTVSDTLTEEQARALAGLAADVSVTVSGVETRTPICIERVNAATGVVTLRWMPASTVTDTWVTANTPTVKPTGGGASGAKVYATLIYGQNAYGDVELGEGGQNVKILINPPGSAGAGDPREQRGTIAWTVQGFACAILQDAFMVRVEHGASN